MRVSAILLAAGESRRMGTVNKLALPVGGRALVRRTAETLLQAGLEQVVAVVGHERDSVSALLQGLPLRIVHNEDYREGQMTSVFCGMAALPNDCDAVLVCLADLPLLTAEDLMRLIAAFADCPTSVLVPTYQGVRGNPILLAHAHRDQILAGDRNLGCRRLIEKNPALVTTLEMADDHTVFDLDTPDAYRELQQRLGETSVAQAISNCG
jgi:molybdenum cofactor cytidylyltransferase